MEFLKLSLTLNFQPRFNLKDMSDTLIWFHLLIIRCKLFI